jgi:hypothetical protein
MADNVLRTEKRFSPSQCIQYRNFSSAFLYGRLALTTHFV